MYLMQKWLLRFYNVDDLLKGYCHLKNKKIWSNYQIWFRVFELWESYRVNIRRYFHVFFLFSPHSYAQRCYYCRFHNRRRRMYFRMIFNRNLRFSSFTDFLRFAIMVLKSALESRTSMKIYKDCILNLNQLKVLTIFYCQCSVDFSFWKS
jgi:hypothetical protein